ncbi:conserved hypothetical protein [Cupriavidus taiwanensis]|uniref:DUF6361 family protein n=1 Tax=Cupriavidus taiwanensis TaxID=164546 RepID=UPI000E162B86|nr:DUF6361 family protein [Cupriavidus taiwanensis]SOY78683.1 conserved hypothetical protein [Cupriavidus taiwanensis]SOY80467.1 conserved hypothetical protein [Cupriavidus taiwanensis]
MASSISWLDHDSIARERSLRLLSLFSEREARDELGIGGIRDSIADQLFPGTSTIQTRLKYMLFVPWLYASLESRGIAGSAFPTAGRQAESRLLSELIKNVPTDEWGIIGREAGSALKRLPSSVYWAGMGAWGLRRFAGTQQQYFAQAERIRALRKARRRRDDGEEHDGDAPGSAWQSRLIELMPKAFPDGADLSLTRDESALLLDQWRLAQPDSLLTWLALDAAKTGNLPQADWIWAHPRAAEFPCHIRSLLEHARRFSALVEGAALLYNLQLSELSKREERVEEYSGRLADWSEQHAPQLNGWDLSNFWPLVLNHGHRISGETRKFVQSWLDAVVEAGRSVGELKVARQLIEARETHLKDGRSRFTNRAALNQWGGSSGLQRLGYRWPTASSFLAEWHMGMNT